MKFITALIVLFSFGCIINTNPRLTPEQTTKMVSMKLYTDRAELNDRNYTVLSAVTGRAYMRGSLFEKGRMNMDEAYDEMKHKATVMGADALLLSSCQEIGLTAQSFRTMECTASAIKFEH